MARRNIADHDVGFDEASTVIDDRNAQFDIDDEPSEERWHIIGRASGGKLLFVVFTEEEDYDDVIIRIISARKATRREREAYNAGAAP